MTPLKVLLRHIRAAKNSSLEGQGRHLFCMWVALLFHPEHLYALRKARKKGQKKVEHQNRLGAQPEPVICSNVHGALPALEVGL